MTFDEFKAAVSEALGPLAKSPENPEGGEAFYSPGEDKPWVVLCDEPYEHATPEQAIAQAEKLQGLV